jgi:co-chaperonin GroES (HSP10)
MSDGTKTVYEIDGEVVADVRNAAELVDKIELFPGWVVVEKVKLSQTTRLGIILPNADTKDQQHLMLFRVATTGPGKITGYDEDGKPKMRDMPVKPGDVVLLKPGVAQMVINQNHQFAVIADVDIIGRISVALKPAEKIDTAELARAAMSKG